MAMDIFSGSNVTVEVGTHTAGSTEVATDFKQIPELGSFPTIGAENVVIDVVEYNNKYNRKLIGSKSVPDITLTLHYLPDNAVHQDLLVAEENQLRKQFRITYYEDGTHTTGYQVVVVGFVSSSVTSGDKDDVVNRDFVIAVDGGPLEAKVIPVV